MRYLLLTIVSLSLLSCSNSQFEAEIKRIDSLQLRLAVAEKQIDSVNQDMLLDLAGNASNQLKFIQKNYRDTMSKDLAFALGEYKSAYRNMQKLIKRANHTKEELEKSEKQLINLKADIVNNLLSKTQVEEFLKNETEIAGEVIASASAYPKASDRYVANYNGIYPLVDSVIHEMNINGIR